MLASSFPGELRCVPVVLRDSETGGVGSGKQMEHPRGSEAASGGLTTRLSPMAPGTHWNAVRSTTSRRRQGWCGGRLGGCGPGFSGGSGGLATGPHGRDVGVRGTPDRLRRSVVRGAGRSGAGRAQTSIDDACTQHFAATGLLVLDDLSSPEPTTAASAKRSDYLVGCRSLPLADGSPLRSLP